MSDDLKPCPYCGQEDPGLHLMMTRAPSGGRWAYFCESCQCCGPEGDTVDEARELWDTRPSLWRPIETAPRDGTRALVSGVGYGVEICRWDNHLVGWVDDYGEIRRAGCTHWQPLPEPPTEGDRR